MSNVTKLHYHKAYDIIHRDFILDLEHLKEVKKVDFKGEDDPEFIPAISVRLNDTWITFLMLDNEEQEAMYRQMRKSILKYGSN